MATESSPPCERCGRASTIELEMRAKGGQLLTMLSCSRCEHRSWRADDQPVSMAEVLRITSGDADFTMAPSSKRERAERG